METQQIFPMQVPAFFIEKQGESLGSGGFGVVMKQTVNGKVYAVKWLREISNFKLVQHEAQSMMHLQHPHLVGFIGLAIDDKEIGLMLEFMAGGDLCTFLHDPATKAERTLTPEMQKRWSLQITSGLQYIHSQQIVHRDMKSMNILLSGDLSVAKIADFGLAKVKSMTKQTAHTTIAGTFVYLAPEIRNYTARHSFESDVFALGLLIFEIYSRTLIEDVVLKEDVDMGVSDPTVKNIIQQCLSIDRKDRPTCIQIMNALEDKPSNLQFLSVVASLSLEAVASTFSYMSGQRHEQVPESPVAENTVERQHVHVFSVAPTLTSYSERHDSGFNSPLESRDSSQVSIQDTQMLQRMDTLRVLNKHRKSVSQLNPKDLHKWIQNFLPSQTLLNRQFYHAVESEDVQECLKLLDQGADPNVKAQNGLTPLMFASHERQFEMCQLLINNGADLNCRDKSSSAALHYAAIAGHADICELLIRNGANPNLKGKGGNAALHYAVLKEHVNICKLLVDKRVDLNLKNKEEMTPLHFAVTQENLEISQILVQGGACLNVQGVHRGTALHYAICAQNMDLVKLLLNGADLNLKAMDGLTPLDLSASIGHLDICQLLLQRESNARDKCLLLAAKNGHLAVCTLLLDNGSDIHSKHMTGETSLHLASKHGHLSVCQLLIEHGADPNARTLFNRTPLDQAKDQQIQEYLKTVTRKKSLFK